MIRAHLAFVIVVVSCLGFASSTAWAAEPLPAKLQAKILLKSISYDRNLAKTAAMSIRIGVICRAGDPASEAAGKKVVTELTRAGAKNKIQKKFVSAELVRLAPNSDPVAAITSKNLYAIYICEGLDDVIQVLVNTAASKKMLTMAGVDRFVRHKGVALGVVKRANKPRILVNLNAARSQGANFDHRFLRLTELIK